MRVQVHINPETLRLQTPERTLTLTLGQGGRACWFEDDPQHLEALAQALEPHAWVLPPDGGLLSGLTVGANLALGLSDGVQAAGAAQDEAVRSALLQAGMSPQTLARLHHLQPGDLNPLERWTVAWVIALRRAPHLWVLNQPFRDLNHAQQRAVLAMVALFEASHPTCPVLWLQQSPALSPPCVAVSAQDTDQPSEAAACLC